MITFCHRCANQRAIKMIAPSQCTHGGIAGSPDKGEPRKLVYKGSVGQEKPGLLTREGARTVRRGLHPHLGRPTPEEREAQRKKDMPKVRDFGAMLQQNAPGLSDSDVANVVKSVDWWLRDIEHFYRMNRDADAQDITSRILDVLRQEGE